MKRWVIVLVLALLLPVSVAAQQPGLREWASALQSGLSNAAERAGRGDVAAARSEITRVYLDYFEIIEGWYGPGGAFASPAYATEVAATEAAFHVLLRATPAEAVRAGALRLRETMAALQARIEGSGAPLYPTAVSGSAAPRRVARRLMSTELSPWSDELQAARAAVEQAQYARALRRVERIYLEGLEPLESRLPAELVSAIERTVHLRLRPALKSGASGVTAELDVFAGQLAAADAFLMRGGSFWFGAVNSLVIIVREGLEAVLLIGALLAYLTATRASRHQRRRIWLGALGGIAASLLTWVVARTVVPVNGASRELIEGITALIAVGVLLYVSHWLFQKTYIHDWKEYLREHLGTAVSRGSRLAMMGLAFAAVYREGFETVLFYQALLLDVGGTAVLTGFVPGVVAITAVGWAIIRAGMKLPLKRVFAVTNTILLYLAFVFLGKGVFNLQESGLFSAHPIEWLPAHPALQQLFGFYPVIETIAAQAVLAALMLGVLFYYRRSVALSAHERERAAALAA